MKNLLDFIAETLSISLEGIPVAMGNSTDEEENPTPVTATSASGDHHSSKTEPTMT